MAMIYSPVTHHPIPSNHTTLLLPLPLRTQLPCLALARRPHLPRHSHHQRVRAPYRSGGGRAWDALDDAGAVHVGGAANAQLAALVPAKHVEAAVLADGSVVAARPPSKHFPEPRGLF